MDTRDPAKDSPLTDPAEATPAEATPADATPDDRMAATRDATTTVADADTTDAEEQASQALERSACTPPVRDPLASQIDKASIFSSLFGGAIGPAFRIDRFTLLARVGGGAMGEVYAAYDPRLDRKVAIKLVRQRADRPVRAQRQLLREARVMARVEHANVVRVYDAGTCEGRVYIAMEFVRGTTLRTWLDRLDGLDPGARQAEVLRLYAAAGRGLQAAHDVGLVHRDFKPDNVLVGDDGQPRVGDFGLARQSAATGEPEPEPRVEGERPVPRVSWSPTISGQVAGTPRYMSPEQWRGEAPDHRSDQFSFCVALHEALLGRSPFPGDSVEQLMAATTAGTIDPPLRASGLPAPIWQALARGLAVDPDQRFPDMAALLTALTPAPRRGRRWGLLLLSAAAIAALLYLTPTTTDPCADAATAMDPVWNDERRSAIRARFAASSAPGALAAWAIAKPQLADYADSWRIERVQACQATHVRRTQSPEQLERRRICLERGLHRLDGLLSALAIGTERDPEALQRVVQAASELPSLDSCRDSGLLAYGVAPPSQEQRPRLARIRQKLALARAEERLGNLDEALSLARAAVESARAEDYVPMLAEALFQEGRVLTQKGHHRKVRAGEQMIRRAIGLAEGARHDQLVAEALAFLVLRAYHEHDTGERTQQLTGRAFAANQRIGDPVRERAMLLRRQGMLLARGGHLEQAEETQRQALPLLEQLDARDAPWLFRAIHLHDLGNTVRDRGRQDEAGALYRESRALYARLGHDHPYLSAIDYDLAVLALRRGDLAAARTGLEQVLRARERALGPAHPKVADTWLALADVHWSSGALELARQAAERALETYRQVLQDSDVRLARARQMIGALQFTDEQHTAARVSYQQALESFQARYGDDHVDVGMAQANIAEVELALGRPRAARAALSEARSIARLSDAPGHRRLREFIDGLAAQLETLASPATSSAPVPAP